MGKQGAVVGMKAEPKELCFWVWLCYLSAVKTENNLPHLLSSNFMRGFFSPFELAPALNISEIPHWRSV